MPDAFSNLGQSRIFNIPISVVIFLFLFAMGVVLMNHTKFGRYVYAIGNNADALQASGINVFLIRQMTFVITGHFAGWQVRSMYHVSAERSLAWERRWNFPVLLLWW